MPFMVFHDLSITEVCRPVFEDSFKSSIEYLLWTLKTLFCVGYVLARDGGGADIKETHTG